MRTEDEEEPVPHMISRDDCNGLLMSSYYLWIAVPSALRVIHLMKRREISLL
jgi:hypothetical protein